MMNQNSAPKTGREDNKPVRRRQRQTLSCLPCRRLKVKCDRGHPCRHCMWSDRVASCQYAAFPQTNANSRASSDVVGLSDEDQTVPPSTPPPSNKPHTTVLLPKTQYDISTPDSNQASKRNDEAEDTKSFAEETKFFHQKFPSWASKARGATHWLSVSQKIGHGCSVSNKSPLRKIYIASLADVFENIEDNFTSSIFPANYPFGSGYEEQFPSKKEILTYVPNQETTMYLIRIYMDTIERTHPLLHSPSFYEELKQFWKKPTEVEDGWLAQFLMMLGLGFHFSRGLSSTTGDEDTLRRFFRGAETCLKSTFFLFSPSLSSLRTLSMMVLSRRILASTCLELDACGPLMSTVVKMAMSVGLNMDRPDDKELSFLEREMRRKLWVTITMMEASISMVTGTSSLFQFSDTDTKEPANLNDTELDLPSLCCCVARPQSEFTDSTFSILLARSISTAFDVIAHANSASIRLRYDNVLVYDSKLKDILKQVSHLYCQSPSVPLEEWKENQKFMLEIFLRRILLSLHSHHGLAPNADIDFPVSYWYTLECSLALLVIQRQLSEDANSPKSRLWLAEHFKHDFYAAILTICLMVTRNDAEHVENASNGVTTKNKIEFPQRETMLQTVLCCREIWARRICKTYCHFLSHVNLGTIISSMVKPEGDNMSLNDLYNLSLQDSFRILKNCQCGSCATDQGSVKGSVASHPGFLAA